MSSTMSRGSRRPPSSTSISASSARRPKPSAEHGREPAGTAPEAASAAPGGSAPGTPPDSAPGTAPDAAPAGSAPAGSAPAPAPADWKTRCYRPPVVRVAERRDSGRRALRLLEGSDTSGGGPRPPTRAGVAATKPAAPADPRVAGGWLTVQQAARRLNLGPKYVYTLIYAEELGATNFGKRQWRVHESDLAEFIARRAARRPGDREA